MQRFRAVLWGGSFLCLLTYLWTWLTVSMGKEASQRTFTIEG